MSKQSRGLPGKYTAVKPSLATCVKEQVYTNGIQFQRWHDRRAMDTAKKMAEVVKGRAKKQLRYSDLIP